MVEGTIKRATRRGIRAVGRIFEEKDDAVDRLQRG